MTEIHSLINSPGSKVDQTGESCITALIDADSIIYVVGWHNKDEEDTEKVTNDLDKFIHDILVKNQARQFAGFFSDKVTFRHKIYPEYKANRREIHEGIAKWKPYIIEYCMQAWNFDLIPNLEADDAVASLQLNMKNTVICSPDKDMLQIPGNHYDYKKNTSCYISEYQGEYNWAFQMLVGDTVDNIKGVPKIGKVGAEKILPPVTSPGITTIKDVVYQEYLKKFGDAESYNLHCELIGMGMTEPKFSALHTFDLDNTISLDYISSPENSDESPEDIFSLM